MANDADWCRLHNLSPGDRFTVTPVYGAQESRISIIYELTAIGEYAILARKIVNGRRRPEAAMSRTCYYHVLQPLAKETAP